jgi:hypothetical protein
LVLAETEPWQPMALAYIMLKYPGAEIRADIPA